MSARGSKRSVKVWKHPLHSKAFYCHHFKTKDTQLFLKHFPRWSFDPLVKETKYILIQGQVIQSQHQAKCSFRRHCVAGCRVRELTSSCAWQNNPQGPRSKSRREEKESEEMNWVQGKAPRCALTMEEQPIYTHKMSLKINYLRNAIAGIPQWLWGTCTAKSSGKQRKLNWKGQSSNALDFLYYTGWDYLCNLHHSGKKG